MKKLTIIFMAIIMFFMPILMTYNHQVAHASLISKPITITAKKVAKDLAIDSAVAMAEHILFEKAMKDFLDKDMNKVDAGFAPICLDGSMSLDDCPQDKRSQVKKDLTSSDKSTLSEKVENIIEKKTNTSSKWTKFLDWFVPIFLISGLVAVFASFMDSESESLIDEIAQESLIESGLLKPLNLDVTTEYNPKDFKPYVQSAIVENRINGYSLETTVLIQLKPNKEFVLSHNKLNVIVTGVVRLKWEGFAHTGGIHGSGDDKATYGLGIVRRFYDGNRNYDVNPNIEVYRSNMIPYDEKVGLGPAYQLGVIGLTSYFNTFQTSSADINDILNTWFRQLNTVYPVEIKISDLVAPPVEIDYGKQTGIDKIKNPDGTVTTPGIESFKYTYNNTYIYPTNDSTTGWKDKTTGEDIAVVEDDILVDTDIDKPVDPENPEEPYPSCTKNFKKIEFKKVGTAFTYAFPFSIPWDIKRFLDAAFSGVGSERPSFQLPHYFGDVTLEIPQYFDSWVVFLRSFIIITFDISLIYLFYRFMKGGD